VEFDGVICDLDGTLADTLDDIADAMNRVLEGRRLPVHSRASYKLMVGGGLRNLVQRTLPPESRTDETIVACLDQLVADYREHSLVENHLYDGVAELVNGLRAGGVKLAVLSNKADELTRRIVESLLGPGAFDVVLGAQPGLPL